MPQHAEWRPPQFRQALPALVADFFSAFSPAAWAYCALFVALTLIVKWGDIDLLLHLPVGFLFGTLFAQHFQPLVSGTHLYRLLIEQLGDRPGCPVRLNIWIGDRPTDDFGILYLDSGLLCYEGLNANFRLAAADLSKLSVSDIVSMEDTAGTHVAALPLTPRRNFPTHSINFLRQVKDWNSGSHGEIRDDERLLPPRKKRPFIWALRRENVPLYLVTPLMVISLIIQLWKF